MNLLNKLIQNSLTITRVGLTICIVIVSSVTLAHETVDSKVYLEHIVDIESTQNFTGIFNYSRSGYQSKIYIYQQIKQNGLVKEWVRKSNQQEGFLRINGQISCVTKGYDNEFRANTILQSIEKSNIDTLLKNYNIVISPKELKVANRVAKELMFLAKDNDHYLYKIAFDKETLFPLQFVFLDSKNNILEKGEFTQFIPITTADAMPTISPLRNCISIKHNLIKNKQALWDISWKPIGFNLERVINNKQTKDEQLVYSDSLVYFSVFIEPYSDPRMDNIEKHFGATVVISRKMMLPSDNDKKMSQYLVTVVGEIPVSTAEQIALSLHHQTRLN